MDIAVLMQMEYTGVGAIRLFALRFVPHQIENRCIQMISPIKDEAQSLFGLRGMPSAGAIRNLLDAVAAAD